MCVGARERFWVSRSLYVPVLLVPTEAVCGGSGSNQGSDVDGLGFKSQIDHLLVKSPIPSALSPQVFSASILSPVNGNSSISIIAQCEDKLS